MLLSPWVSRNLLYMPQVAEYPAGPGVRVGTAHMALPVPAICCGHGKHRQWADSFPTACANRLPGASPHISKASRCQPPLFLQMRFVGNIASPPETFSPVQNMT